MKILEKIKNPRNNVINWEDNNCSSQWGIPLGDMFVEGIASYYNPSIKADDCAVSKKNLDGFYIMPNLPWFSDNEKIKTH